MCAYFLKFAVLLPLRSKARTEYHTYPNNEKRPDKYKILTFPELIRDLGSQGKEIN